MACIYDDLYAELDKSNLSKGDFIRMLDDMDDKKTSPGDCKKYWAIDVYLKMSAHPKVPPDVLKLIVEKAYLRGEKVDKILDNGSKKIFDSLWQTGKFNSLAWSSKYADETQLDEIYKSRFSDANSQRSKPFISFVKHPNASDKILEKVVSDFKDAGVVFEIVSRQDLITKPKTFKAVCSKIRESSFSSGKLDSSSDVKDEIFELFLSKPQLSWIQIAEGIDLEEQLKIYFGNKSKTNNKRQKLLMDFCRRKECPENMKLVIYNATGNEEFLPPLAQDIFLF